MINFGALNINSMAVGQKQVNEAYVGSNKIWPTTQAEVYIPKSYLYFDGTTGINTGIDQLGNPSVFIDFQNTAFTNVQFYMPFGVRVGTGTNDSFLIVANYTSSRYIFQYGATMTAYTIGTLAVNTNRRTISIVNKVATMTVLANGNTANVTASAAAPVNAGNIWLGCAANSDGPIAGSMHVGNIYSFTIQKNNVYVLNMTPVQKQSTGEYGMLDSVSGNFFGNATGQGTITGG